MALADQSKLVFTHGAPSSALKCSICHELFLDPVISVVCGHTFCFKCIQSARLPCPMDKNSLRGDKVIPNLAIAGQIADLSIFCINATFIAPGESESIHGFDLSGNDVGVASPFNGCREIITVGKLEEHETQCQYSKVPCPNNSECGLLSRRDLPDHLQSCVFHPCKYFGTGCTERGGSQAMAMHSKTCSFGDPVILNSKLLSKLHELCQQMKTTTETFENRMSQLEARQDGLNQRLTKCLEQVKTSRPVSVSAEKMMSSSSSSMYEVAALRKGPFATKSDAIGIAGEMVMPFNFQCVGTFETHTGTVWNIAAKKNILFTSGGDHIINVWDLGLDSPSRIRTIVVEHEDEGIIHSVSVIDDYLYVGIDKKIIVYDIMDEMKELHSVSSDDIISALEFAGEYLFVASFATIGVYSLETLRPITTITQGLSHWVRPLVTNANQALLYSACHNVIHCWDVQSFECRIECAIDYGSINSLVVTPKYVICGTYNQNIHVYDLKMNHVRQLGGHLGTIHSLALSPQSKYLFSASLDTTIKVWNLENMLMVQTLKRHQGSVNALMWSGYLLFSGSADKTVKVYKPFKGQVVNNKGDTSQQPANNPSLQACWGNSGNLPPRIPASPRKMKNNSVRQAVARSAPSSFKKQLLPSNESEI